MQKKLFWFGLAYILITLLFAFVPNTFFNYGYNYYQFLPIGWLMIPVVLIVLLLGLTRHESNLSQVKSVKLLAALVVIVFPFLCWFLRTQIHCFGGDGAVGYVVSSEFSIADWIPPLPGKGRLDGYASGFVAKCCRKVGLFDNSAVLTSILSTQVYSVVLGVVFCSLAFVAFRKRQRMFFILMTMPFVFNFFGNVDNYSLSLAMGMFILCFHVRAFNMEKPNLVALFGLAALWGIGMWTHPFHVFWGFPLAYLFGRWLHQFEAFKRLPTWATGVLFGLVLLIAVKISPNGNHWFLWETSKVPPTFSIDTLTHYINMILLPSVPLIGCLLVESRPATDYGKIKDALALFLSASCCFFALAFTIGAVDQFNYQHLLFFISVPLILVIQKVRMTPLATAVVVICNLSLLIPLVAVHSSDRTVARAEFVYPLDPCQHNRVMSWQTHLGLCLGDNLHENPIVKRAVLRTFANGARHACPEGFRGGNYIYHTAFLYHYGDFAQGRTQLYGLLTQNPQLVRWFLSERPGFIYCNRKKLWEDIDAFLVAQRSPQLSEYRKVVAQIAERCKQNPYYLKRPSYAVTEY